MSYVLRYTVDGTEKEFPISGREIIVGRAPDCHLVLNQPGISRHHCKMTVESGGVFISDLKSKNGTRVNNIYIKRVQLGNGDQILVAEFMLGFHQAGPSTMPFPSEPERQSDQMVLLSDQKELHEEAGTIIRRVNDFQDIIASKDPRQDEAQRITTVLIKVAEALIAVNTLDQIIGKLMDLIFEHLPADRGFLMLRDENEQLVPKVVRHREHGESDNIEISRTIAEKALNDKMAILTTDAQVDPRFSAGESIRFLGIKSAMCVPLFHKEKTIGILYLDSPTSAAIFGPNDLDLLTAMANFSAVGIEQTQLNEKILQETSVRQRLERYHSPSIVNRILKNIAGGQSEGEEYNLRVQERDVTILFADIVGFTPFSEKFSPNRIAELLNEYFSAMTEVIFRYEGTLDKYIGDAIMAIFGAPNNMSDHPYRAVCTALGMMEQLEVINRNRPPSEQFAIRIGLNTGRAVAGDIGSIKRMEYTVLGNTVNMASRIESMACKAGQVVIGENTYMAVKDQFECINLGAIQLKGISEKVNVYRVLGFAK
ncbi:adenylate/guanylate cyclase domain-containing protein [Acanthopleuribacter pedis]|uniref:FHA domain-containing protein n=1 Tax=Acanthopleuribacter pedis TaxID=442870 RepID=A0A8J7Q5A3_9BACT|nr:adenylate/guanylate cyclase domain-containing protein [Acanthopleuribacter pedis]MBO1318181.1 FHA domain-containing protein [Acanthopleuribacter pedis]